MSQDDSILWENKNFQEALNSLSDCADLSAEISFDSIDDCEITSFFKKTLLDYKRIVKRCEREGLEISNDIDLYKEEYQSASTVKRLEIIAGLQDQIKTMISSCESPPKYISQKYSEDLVSRIEEGIIDGFEIVDD
jgi:hypothetical protein